MIISTAEIGATVIIDSSDHNSSTPLIVNGVIRKRIVHNVETRLDAAELEALRNSNKVFRIVGAANASETTGGAVMAGASTAPPGTVIETPHGPVTVVPIPDEHRLPGEVPGGTLNVEPFDVDGILAQTIRKITEDMDEFNADQVGDLITAERARERPRPTLIEALTKKQASFAA